MDDNDHVAHAILEAIASRAMLDRGLLPEFSPEALSELADISGPARERGDQVRDLRDLLWASIDNDDSRDLDQLTAAVALSGGKTRILVAVADVDSLVKKGSALDLQAQHNTTSVYTPARIFPMLPEKLSTDLTSLNPQQDRLAIVIDMVIGRDGSLQDSEVYRAVVRNCAQLAYNGVAAWLDGEAEIPEAATSVPGLAEGLRTQDKAAQLMKNLRHRQGALSLQTIEAKAVFDEGSICDLLVEETNRAKEIIEDFMIAANGVTVRYLRSKNFPTIRRVVRTPRRWDRIVEIAAQHGFRLPASPDSRALEAFLKGAKSADPLRFPDLSLAVIKLLGNGEYIAESSKNEGLGHFGLAVQHYTHSTAPNRRYVDLITQRLLKAAIDGRPSPYKIAELEDLAAHCTEMEDLVTKVERQMGKSAAALLLKNRIGERFEALVTGAAPKGTWVRLIDMPVEGMLKSGQQGVDVGDHIRVQLISIDIERGFIDFKRVGHSRG
jgi:ribonuclease R